MVWLSWAISAFGIVGLWIAGSGKWWGWAVALGTQVLWFVYIIGTKQWGLLPAVVAFTVVYARNLLKWIKANRLVEESV
jgi:hypothetical protein